MRFIYTGSICPETDVPGMFSCVDEERIPEAAAYVEVGTFRTEVGAAKFKVLYSGIVERGQEIEVTQGGDCLPTELVLITSAGNDTASSQIVAIDATCSDVELPLLENYGAFEISGYACEGDAVPHLCYVDALFAMVATNAGQGNLTVTSFGFTLDGATKDVLQDIADSDRFLDPAEVLVAKDISVALELCIDKEYLAKSAVQGDGGECTADAEILIGPGQPKPNTPSPIVSPAPSPPSSSPATTPAPSIGATLPGTDAPTPLTTGTITSVPSTGAPIVLGTNAPTPLAAGPTTAVPSTVAPLPGTNAPTRLTTRPSTPVPSSVGSVIVPGTNAPTPLAARPTTTVPSTVAPLPGTQRPTTLAPAPDTDAPTTASPNSVPTTTPPSECVLDVQTACTPPPGSDSCEEIRIEPVLCQNSPKSMEFQYNGGDCQGSFNAQSFPLFVCQDFNGGPPTGLGSLSYIVVTDIRGAGIVYFSGWVGVGELFSIESADGTLLEANHNVTIYGSNETKPDSIVQTLTFHSSCSDTPDTESLFLKDSFGAVQLVGFSSTEQGEVSCFVKAEIEASVTVNSSISGQPITLTSFVSTITSAPGGVDDETNFTSQVTGEEVTSDGPSVDVTFDLDLNLTVRRTYSVFTTVTGVTADGRRCQGSSLFQFAAGQPPPPLFPTISPTPFPTRSIQPSPDPEITPCELTAVLTCIVIRGGSNTCEGLQNPSDVTCTGNMYPSSLTFQYTGDRCPVNPQNFVCDDTELNTGAPREAVFIEATDGERILGFDNVGLNDFLTIEGEYGANTTFTIYTSVDGVRGEVLQILDIPTACNPDDDLTLLKQYGALQLTGFANAASGEQGIEAQIELIYAVENSGFQVTEVESALIIDAFDGGPIEVVDDPFLLEGSAVTILNRNEQILNLRLKEQLGRIDTFFLSVRGSAVSNDLSCSNTAQLSF
jgi:hypothetical protein